MKFTSAKTGVSRIYETLIPRSVLTLRATLHQLNAFSHPSLFVPLVQFLSVSLVRRGHPGPERVRRNNDERPRLIYRGHATIFTHFPGVLLARGDAVSPRTDRLLRNYGHRVVKNHLAVLGTGSKQR